MKFQISLLVLCLVAAAFADFECKKDVPYKENECNTCRCANGQFACTFMACHSPKSKELYNCEVGTEWKNNCNECWCVKDMGTVCTNYDC
ncbi:hypothetical protein RN001_015506 [Aquatica leii]|uniref:Pacifastin domain-containing protein n=1 Tax=Aquatica leii TaxID=1421715 RepID=A0AAN7NZ50_9COLE|nr:hypothetical protein RN001_015506 [Aquatica leii]